MFNDLVRLAYWSLVADSMMYCLVQISIAEAIELSRKRLTKIPTIIMALDEEDPA